MNDKQKIEYFEMLIKRNCILFFDDKVYNKWDSEVNLIQYMDKKFQKYIKDLLKEKKE